MHVQTSISSPSLSSVSGLTICAAVSLPSASHKSTTHPAPTELRGPRGRLWALRFDLPRSGTSFPFFPPHRINTWIDFDLRVVIFFSIWDYDESQDEVDERGEESRTENGEDKAERIKSEWLTRSQSTFRKNGWPMMSAKPVWGWQPRRSLGSCGSKGESTVKDSGWGGVMVGGMRRNVREQRERWRDLAGKVWWEWKLVRGQ